MSPPPTDAELATYYSAYTTTSAVEVRSGWGGKYPRLRKVFHALSGDVDPRDFVVVPANGRVLDYGSGEGTYLLDFHQRGIDISGAEISDILVDACKKIGLGVRKTHGFDTIPFEDGEFDVVYLMQVFEHLRNPRGFMLEISRVLKPGGTLYLALPNASSVWRRVFGGRWVSGWFAPFHVAHYTRTALTGLGSECGLVECGSWSRTPDSWFRLNLKAVLYAHEQALDARRSWLDHAVARYPLILVLRLLECFVRERDCLVVKFRKS
jgi:SAM-dependent methyltransferase